MSSTQGTPISFADSSAPSSFPLPGQAPAQPKSNAILWILLIVVLATGGTLIASTQMGQRGSAGAASRHITISIDSTPQGADIYQMPTGNRVGKTPYNSAVPAAKGDLVFILKLQSHHDAVVTLPADKGGQKAVELRATSE